MQLQDYAQNKPVFETEQLILRPLRKEDVADLKEWLGDSSVYRYWGKRPGKSDLNPDLLFQKPEKPTKSFHWGVVHKQNIASYKTLEKAGFKREGLIREGKMVNTYCDYYLYGMTKADYIEIADKGLPPYEHCERFFRKN